VVERNKLKIIYLFYLHVFFTFPYEKCGAVDMGDKSFYHINKSKYDQMII